MSTKVPNYLRTLRREWELTQEELAALLPKASRDRVSRVERDKALPDAQEIVAYPLIFGRPAAEIFPRDIADIQDAVMRAAYRLHQKVERQTSAAALRKRALTEQILARATGKAKPQKV
jgi:transcriptional regulator with XRE-family HTH domain